MTWNYGLSHSLVWLSRTVSYVLVPTTARQNAPKPTHPAVSIEDQPIASISTSNLGALAAPANSPMSAAGAAHPHTPCLTAPRMVPPGTCRRETPATAARNKVLQCSQHQRPTVSTPINVDELEKELLHHPDRNFVISLINTLRYGTHVGYTGPQMTRVSRNLISASKHPGVVSANLDKEVKLGRVAGPFPFSPLPNLQCHPVGVVPKKHSSEWRTIYHLSHPEGDSLNDYIPKDPYSLQYVKVDDAIRVLQSLGPGSYLAKTDLKSAFRLIPIHPDDWNLLGIYWKAQFYVDLYLPFGLRSAPYLFNQLSEALEWILKHNYGLQHGLHILDDFLVIEPSRVQCLTSFSTLLRVFMSLKAPLVASKTLGPSQVLEFMGIVLDSARTEARLPEDKLARTRELLTSFKRRRSARLVELQSLISTLQFACKVVIPGRTFLQCIINLTSKVPSRFHHIRLNREFFRTLTCGNYSLLGGTGGHSFWITMLPPPQILSYLLMLLAPWALGAISMGSGSRDGGHNLCSSIVSRVLALSGRNYSPFLSLAPFGTPISWENVSNSGVTMSLW